MVVAALRADVEGAGQLRLGHHGPAVGTFAKDRLGDVLTGNVALLPLPARLELNHPLPPLTKGIYHFMPSQSHWRSSSICWSKNPVSYRPLTKSGW